MDKETNNEPMDDDAAFDAGAGFEPVVSEGGGAGAESAEPTVVSDGGGVAGVSAPVAEGEPVVPVDADAAVLSEAGVVVAGSENAGTVDYAAELEKLQKQVADNKAWGTHLAQENAELKKLIEAGTVAAQEKKPSDAATEIPPEIQEYFDSDPAAMKALSFLVERQVAERLPAVKDYGGDVAEIRDRLEQMNFERAVTGGLLTDTGYVAGHPDALTVMTTQDYREWFAVESVKDPRILKVSSPVEAIGVLDRYKDAVAKRAVAAAEKNTQKNDLETMMKGAVPKGTHVAKKAPASVDMTDDEAFEAGTKR